MSQPEEHQFDRRVTDVNYAALNVRLAGVEGRVEVLEEQGKVTNRELGETKLELRANTMLTRQSHDALYGTTEEPGMKDVVDHVRATLDGTDCEPGLTRKVEDMHGMLAPARHAFALAGKVSAGLLRLSDAVERRPKTIGLLVIVSIVAWSAATSGKLPDWFTTMMKALLA